MSEQIYLELLAEDKDSIAYRPRFAAFTGSALAAILLQQTVYWWKKKAGKAFFKFRTPSNHKLYQVGDSWCEELEMNPYEFDTALKVIGTKIVKGMSKTDMLKTSMPIRNDGETDPEFYKRLKVGVSRCVIYWTDSSRVTWYLLNAQLLGNFVSRIYLDNCYSLKYLKSANIAITRQNAKIKDTSEESEITPEKTTTTRAIPPFPVVTTPITTPLMLLPEMVEPRTPSKPAQAERSAKNPTPIAAPPLPIDEFNIVDLYRDTFGEKKLSQKLRDVLYSTAKKYSREWIEEAFELSAIGEAKSLSYTLKILEEWRVNGKPELRLVRKAPPTYVPLPQAAPTSAEVLKRIQDEVAAEYAAEKESAS